MNIRLNSCLSLMHSLKKNCLVESPRRTQSTAAHYQHIIGPPLPSAVSLHTNVGLKNKSRQSYISAILLRTDKTNMNLPRSLGLLHLTLQLLNFFIEIVIYCLHSACAAWNCPLSGFCPHCTVLSTHKDCWYQIMSDPKVSCWYRPR